jgi:hypothetical protein
MYSRAELILLTQTYLSASGLTASMFSRRVTGQGKLFVRLLAGEDCTMRSAEAASIWFDLNWPPDVAWPQGMRPRGSALAVMQPRSERASAAA